MRFTRRHLALASAGVLCTAALGLGSELAAQSRDEAAIAPDVEAFRKAMLAAETQTSSHESRVAPTLAAAADGASMYRVVVMLKDLGTGPDWEERIARARALVMDALKGHRVTVNRHYDGLPVLALTLDREALRILQSHPVVASVAEDGLSTTQGSSSSTR